MNNFERGLVSVSRQDWSFDRRGERDEARHNEKVKEAIKDNLDSIVSDGDIITADPRTKKTVKVPMKSLELPRFKFGDNQGGGGIGFGDGDGDPQPGDVMPGDGDEAGDQPGEEYYEAEFSLDEIQQMVFDDMGLPRLRPKESAEIDSENPEWNDIRKKRSFNNGDLGRTIMRNIMRNAEEGRGAVFHDIEEQDYRVRTWEYEPQPENNAVVIAMMDISGSMSDKKKYMARAFAWWTVNFLRSQYPKVELVFVAHDTEAYEVNEQQFFTRGQGGGTKCSSANEMALNIMDQRFPADRYNVYPIHFSDGDNWGNDNQKCLELVGEMMERDISQYAYVQLQERSSSGLINDYKQNIHDERMKTCVINDKSEVFDALKYVFSPDEETLRRS